MLMCVHCITNIKINTQKCPTDFITAIVSGQLCIEISKVLKCVSVCRSIMTDLYYLSQADGVGEWRMKEAKDLSDLVQNRITYLQVSTDTPAA